MKTAFEEITKKQFQNLIFMMHEQLQKFVMKKGLYHRGILLLTQLVLIKIAQHNYIGYNKNIFKNFHGEITLEDINQNCKNWFYYRYRDTS